MNSTTQDRPPTHAEHPDSPDAATARLRAGLSSADLAHEPARPRSRSRQYVALLLGGVAVAALLVMVWVNVGPAPAPSNTGAGSGIAAADAWARAATRPGADNGGTSAVYLVLHNPGPGQDRLLGASSDAAVTAEVHRTTVEDGVMRMRPTGPIDVPAGATVTLQPGGLHVMLIELRRDLVAGERLAVTLHFERAGDLLVDAEVRAPMPAPMQPAPTHGG